ncbi:hypothetical protein DOY81_007431 [Sarcophaga bullata]|nr:hypothetical protein DOY81_007431 [Sarcophaga bullata]
MDRTNTNTNLKEFSTEAANILKMLTALRHSERMSILEFFSKSLWQVRQAKQSAYFIKVIYNNLK